MLNYRVTLLLLLCSLSVPGLAQDTAVPWLMVDTRHQALKVMVGDHVQQVFRGIAVGRGGASELRYVGDGRTPRGVFHVRWINRHSKFHLFFGLDYPSRAQAEHAYHAARIDFDTYYRISRALLHGRTPPQDTALGGYIGIHGLGRQDPAIHRRLNWTEGCIALTNEQIDRLARWVSIGTRVVIL